MSDCNQGEDEEERRKLKDEKDKARDEKREVLFELLTKFITSVILFSSVHGFISVVKIGLMFYNILFLLYKCH